MYLYRGLSSYADDTNIGVPRHGDVRLIPGPKSGRVDVYFNDSTSLGWGTACGFFWTFDNADVVCQQLGFEHAESFDYAAFSGHEIGTGPVGDFECFGGETHLSECIQYTPLSFCDHNLDVSVTCRSESNTAKHLQSQFPYMH